MKINYKDYYYKYKALKYYLKNYNIENQKQIKGGVNDFINPLSNPLSKKRKNNNNEEVNYLSEDKKEKIKRA